MGRHSIIVTVSPVCVALASSWALNFLLVFRNLPYFGCLAKLSTLTTRVLFILSDTTTPVKVRPPTFFVFVLLGMFLFQKCMNTGYIAAQVPPLSYILGLAAGDGEAEVLVSHYSCRASGLKFSS